MASTLALVVAAWAITVPVVLALGTLLGRLSAPPLVVVAEEPAPAVSDNVVPLVARPANGLEALREAA